MAHTVKEISEKLSLLRSRVAVFDGILNHVQTNYVGSADVQPEAAFIRSDYGVVPQEHLIDTLALITEWIAAANTEIESLESLVVVPPQVTPKLVVSKKEKEPNGAAKTRRRGDDPAAAG